MKILVLGATGQLGTNLVRMLLARNVPVRALIRPTSKGTTLEGLEIERIPRDLNDPNCLAIACQGIQVVYHTPGYYPYSTISGKEARARALKETHNVLDAVRHSSVERFIFTSTLTTIGFPGEP